MKRLAFRTSLAILPLSLVSAILLAQPAWSLEPYNKEQNKRIAPDPGPSNPPGVDLLQRELEIEELKRKVKAQQEYIARLERELADLRKGQAPLPRPPVPPRFRVPGVPIPPPQSNEAPLLPAPGQPLPPGWQEREFNGLKYYVIPVKDLSSR